MQRASRNAIAIIDDALSASVSRNAFSRDQALRTLGDVEAHIGEPELTNRVAEIVNEAAASYRGDALIDRGRFLDTLLDIRALLVGVQGE
jgi:hypothetical protein